jgi:hypothetical protein
MIKLKDILKEGTDSGDKSLAWLLHLEYDAFNKIRKWVKEIKKHSVASKDPKIKRIVKQLFKLEADLGEAINNLDVSDSNRGYDKKRFKRRPTR